MANPNAQALAMAIEIRRKNKRKTIPTPASDTVHELESEPLDEFDVADTVEAPVDVAVEAPVRPMAAMDAVGMARAIMAKHKAPVAADNLDTFDDLDAPPPVKSANDRIAAILRRTRA